MRKFKSILLVAVALYVVKVDNAHAQNKSLQFDGSTNKVVVSNHSDFDFTTQFTLEAWVYAENFKSQAWQGSVINKDADAGGTQTGYVMRIGAGRLEGIVTPGWEGAITPAILRAKKWNHVAMVYKEGEMWLYVNGTQQAYRGGLPTSINKSPVNLQIGECPGFSGRVWDGMIDEVRIWNIVRSEDEIRKNMSTSLTGAETGLVAYYDFDEEDTSGTLTDRTSNGHDGSLGNYGSAYTWTEGYQLSKKDVAMTGIISPIDHPDWTNAEQISVRVQNTAFDSVSDFDVVFEFGDHVYTETIKDTIAPWQSYVYTFKKYIDFTNRQELTVKAYVDWDEDTDETNDAYVKKVKRTSTIRLMDHVQHNFGSEGQIHNTILTLPDDNSDYSELLLHISVACPGGGCDPWDQAGNVKVKKDGKEYEIARFVTPYGKSCGPWTIDVTDFRSVLLGTIDVVSFIEVWGSNGWLLILDLEYVKGEVDKPYSKIIPLYELDRQVYGEPTISYDLEEQTVAIPANTQHAHIRMTNTGHGQANTDNAAEFKEANHHIWINGVEKFRHHLWKGDCNQNSCSPQNGTWPYARAGWCPGQGVTPVWFDLSDVLVPGNDMTIDYELEEYTNLLNTGYNGGSHTEPFYKIYSYLILTSDTPFESYTDIAVDSVSIIEGTIEGTQKVFFELLNNGNQEIEIAEIGYVINNVEGECEELLMDLLPGAKISHELEIPEFSEGESGLLSVYTYVENDIVSSNNVKALAFGGYTNISGVAEQIKLDIYPNPVSGIMNIECNMRMNEVLIQSIDGKLVRRINSDRKAMVVDLADLDSGMYIINIGTEEGNRILRSIIRE